MAAPALSSMSCTQPRLDSTTICGHVRISASDSSAVMISWVFVWVNLLGPSLLRPGEMKYIAVHART
jgi:hypothetical protein